MTAERLRQAADRLDVLAEAATPGPWQSFHHRERADEAHVALEDDEPLAVCDLTTEPQFRDTDAAYIAAMHPGVGKALAAWLRGMAETWGRIEDELRGLEGVPTVEQVYGYDLTDALAAANAILGGAT